MAVESLAYLLHMALTRFCTVAFYGLWVRTEALILVFEAFWSKVRDLGQGKSLRLGLWGLFIFFRNQPPVNKKVGWTQQKNSFLMDVCMNPKLLVFLETRVNLLPFGKIRFFFRWLWYFIKVGSFDRPLFRESRHALFQKINLDCLQPLLQKFFVLL